MNSQNFLDHYGYFLLHVTLRKVSEVSILFYYLQIKSKIMIKIIQYLLFFSLESKRFCVNNTCQFVFSKENIINIGYISKKKRPHEEGAKY